ncbi:MAG: DUF3617 domain-containing protein [Panacagrimonas sp.]
MMIPGNGLVVGLVVAATLASIPLAAQADIQQKPGLWEGSVKMDLSSVMANLPPETAAQMKAMGIEMPTGTAIKTQFCLTPEQAAKNVVPQVTDAQSGCSVTDSRRSGDTLTASVHCDGAMKGDGGMEVKLGSPESYTGTMRFSGLSDQGLALEMNNEFSGRWVSASCGSVKPMQ